MKVWDFKLTMAKYRRKAGVSFDLGGALVTSEVEEDVFIEKIAPEHRQKLLEQS